LLTLAAPAVDRRAAAAFMLVIAPNRYRSGIRFPGISADKLRFPVLRSVDFVPLRASKRAGWELIGQRPREGRSGSTTNDPKWYVKRPMATKPV
jgi:hypothetical protein